MESNLIHFIDELKRIELNLTNPKLRISDNVKSVLLNKRNEILGKINLLPQVNKLYKVLYYDSKGSPIYTTIIKANTEYEIQFFAKYIAGRYKVNYSSISHVEIQTAKLEKIKLHSRK